MFCFSHTYLYISFTNWHYVISVINVTINCNILSCCTNVDMYSEGPGWDNDYTELSSVPMSSNVLQYRPYQIKASSFLIIRHPTNHRYSFFPMHNSLRAQGLLITEASLAHSNTQHLVGLLCQFAAVQSEELIVSRINNKERKKEIYRECQNVKLRTI